MRDNGMVEAFRGDGQGAIEAFRGEGQKDDRTIQG